MQPNRVGHRSEPNRVPGPTHAPGSGGKEGRHFEILRMGEAIEGTQHKHVVITHATFIGQLGAITVGLCKILRPVHSVYMVQGGCCLGPIIMVAAVEWL